jgi:hypothetical protein
MSKAQEELARSTDPSGSPSVDPEVVRDRQRDDKGRDAASSASASVTLQIPGRNSTRRRLPCGIGRLGRGIALDARARAPFYKSDWTDAWNYRVVPATALIFFAK